MVLFERKFSLCLFFSLVLTFRSGLDSELLRLAYAVEYPNLFRLVCDISQGHKYSTMKLPANELIFRFA